MSRFKDWVKDLVSSSKSDSPYYDESSADDFWNEPQNMHSTLDYYKLFEYDVKNDYLKNIHNGVRHLLYKSDVDFSKLLTAAINYDRDNDTNIVTLILDTVMSCSIYHQDKVMRDIFSIIPISYKPFEEFIIANMDSIILSYSDGIASLLDYLCCNTSTKQAFMTHIENLASSLYIEDLEDIFANHSDIGSLILREIFEIYFVQGKDNICITSYELFQCVIFLPISCYDYLYLRDIIRKNWSRLLYYESLDSYSELYDIYITLINEFDVEEAEIKNFLSKMFDEDLKYEIESNETSFDSILSYELQTMLNFSVGYEVIEKNLRNLTEAFGTEFYHELKTWFRKESILTVRCAKILEDLDEC